jgi:hypothetical protein
MLLESKTLAEGDTRRYRIDYSEFLNRGETLSAVVVTITSPAVPTSAIGAGALAPALTVDKKSVIFYLVAGDSGEAVTVKIATTTSLSEIVNDTLDFVIVSP